MHPSPLTPHPSHFPLFPPKKESSPKNQETLTQPRPLSQLLPIGDLDQRDLMLAAQGDDELLVGLLLASLVEDAHVRLAAVERLAGLAQPARQAVVDEGQLEHALEGLEHRHLALGAAAAAAAVRRHFDFVRRRHGRGGLFSVRLWRGEGGVSGCGFGGGWRWGIGKGG